MMLPAVDMKGTGENIKLLMRANGIKVGDLVDALCVTEVAVYRWLSGVRLPTYDNMVKLGVILDEPLDNIIVLSETSIEWERRKV